MKLKDLKENEKFRFVNNVALTGVYFKGRPIYPSHMDYNYIHEVGIPLDVFAAHEDTEVTKEE